MDYSDKAAAILRSILETPLPAPAEAPNLPRRHVTIHIGKIVIQLPPQPSPSS